VKKGGKEYTFIFRKIHTSFAGRSFHAANAYLAAFLFYKKVLKACILYRKEPFLNFSLKMADSFTNIGIVLAKSKSECKKAIIKRTIESKRMG